MTTLNIKTGVPHFAGLVKQYRSFSYTIGKCLNEFIDNVIYKCTRIAITIDEMPGTKKIKSIKITDNYENGFENICEDGVKNPFNVTHTRDGHNDDNETSQFGIGMKSAGIACAENMDIYTKVKDNYYHVECDFVKMSRRVNAIESHDPSFSQIDKYAFYQKHDNDNGSTIILQNIRPEIADIVNNKFIERLRKEISETYGEIVKETGVQLELNGERIIPGIDYFNEPSCLQYTKYSRIYIFEREITVLEFTKIETTYYVENNFDGTEKYFVYDEDKEKLYQEKKMTSKYIPKTNEKFVGCFSDEKKFAIELTGTTTFLHPNSSDKVSDSNRFVPKGRTLVFRQGRCYGILPQPAKSSTDGYNNYSENKIEFSSKKILTDAGMSLNKIFRNEDDNKTLLKLINIVLQNLKKESITIIKSKSQTMETVKKIVVPPKKQEMNVFQKLIAPIEIKPVLPAETKVIIETKKVEMKKALPETKKINPEIIQETKKINPEIIQETKKIEPEIIQKTKKIEPEIIQENLKIDKIEPVEEIISIKPEYKSDDGLKIIDRLIQNNGISDEKINILHDIICDYMDNCDRQQLNIIFKNIIVKEKLKILYDLVKSRYSRNQEMMSGKKLFEL